MMASANVESSYRLSLLEASYVMVLRPQDLEPINTPMLRKGVEWVLEQAQVPENESAWDQFWWRRFTRDSEGNVCGTRFCLAGYICDMDPDWIWSPTMGVNEAWIVDIFGRSGGATFSGVDGETAAEHARRVLGITHVEAGFLWNENNSAADILKVARIICEKRGESLGI